MSRRMSSSPEVPVRARLDLSPSPAPEEVDVEHCIICLQDIVDRTVLPNCAHDRFCFECLVVWTEQSRKCPLCQQAIGAYLVHHIRSHTDQSKYYLPPLRSSPLPDRLAASSSRTLNRVTRTSRAQVWGQVQELRRDEHEERALQKRRWIYQHDLYAKHVASNTYTKYRPYPTPSQFAGQDDLVRRTTAFVRRELHVWENVDTEFLTTFVISLMKSIDLRSEAAIKLLSEFLDTGEQPYVPGTRYGNAEHFAHEVYSYLRSPFHELSVYDSQVQYDAAPDGSKPYDRQPRVDLPNRAQRWRPPPERRPPQHVNESLDARGFRPPSPLRDRRERQSQIRERSASWDRRRSPSPSRSRSRQRSRSRSAHYLRHRSSLGRGSLYRQSRRSRSRSRSRSSRSHSPLPPRRRYSSPRPYLESRLRSRVSLQRSRSHTLLSQPSRSRSSDRSRSRSADSQRSCRSSHQEENKDEVLHSHEEPLVADNRSVDLEMAQVVERKPRPVGRPPRQTALSSIRAHLGASSTVAPLNLRAGSPSRKRSLSERMDETSALLRPAKRRSLAQRIDLNDTKPVPALEVMTPVMDEHCQSDDDKQGHVDADVDNMAVDVVEHPIVERSSAREIMARTRARLAALKQEVISAVSLEASEEQNSTPSQVEAQSSAIAPSVQAGALRKILLARLDEEKRKALSVKTSSNIGGTIPQDAEAEERRLRLKVKLSVAKRQTSMSAVGTKL